MGNIYSEKLGNLRKEMIEKIIEVVRERGRIVGTRKELCLYDGEEIGQDVCIHDTMDIMRVWILQVTPENNVWVCTDCDNVLLTYISADDICTILNHIISMSDEDIQKCFEWADDI